MNPPSIPANITEVDATWLSTALGKQVRQFDVTRIGQGVGIMGDIYRISLAYADDSAAPASVVVKFPSSFEENRSQGIALGMFEAEVRFYNELAPRLNVGVPEVYLARIETGTAEFVIVMEDLSEYALVAQGTGMTLEQARAAVTVLAHVHAHWWNNVQTEALEWIPAMTGPRIDFVDQVLPGVFAGFAEGFSQYLPAGGLALFEAFVGNYMKVNKILAGRSPWTLAHQDFRVENLLFGTAEDHHPVMVLDWQGIGRGPGVYDLAYILGGSMTEKLRQRHEYELVGTYHATLRSLGIDDYSIEQCRADYGLAHLMGGIGHTDTAWRRHGLEQRARRSAGCDHGVTTRTGRAGP